MKKLPFFLILSLLLSLQACGQTGSLYHPDENAPIQVEKEAT